MYQKLSKSDVQRQQRAQQQQEEQKNWDQQWCRFQSEEKKFEYHLEVCECLWLLTLPFEVWRQYACDYPYWIPKGKGLQGSIQSVHDYEDKKKKFQVELMKYHERYKPVKLQTHQGSVFHRMLKVQIMTQPKVFSNLCQTMTRGEEYEQHWQINIQNTINFFVRLGYGINDHDDAQRTVVHKIAFDGNDQLMKMLLKSSTHLSKEYRRSARKDLEILSSVDLEAKDLSSDTPLMDACASGNPDLIRLLLELGADASVQNVRAQSMFQIAQQRGKQEVVQLCMAFFEQKKLEVQLAADIPALKANKKRL